MVSPHYSSSPDDVAHSVFQLNYSEDKSLREMFEKADMTFTGNNVWKAVINELLRERRSLKDHIAKLERIIPRRMEIDGKVFAWNCPEDAIPVEKPKLG